VAARGQAGAEGGEADRRGAGAGGAEHAGRAGQRVERRGDVGVRPDEVRAEAVDQQHGHPPGTGQGVGEPQRVDGQPGAVHGRAEGGGDAGQDVGQGGGAVGRPGQVVREEAGRHGLVASTCRPVATSR
jgi:hypothetical protein